MSVKVHIRHIHTDPIYTGNTSVISDVINVIDMKEVLNTCLLYNRHISAHYQLQSLLQLSRAFVYNLYYSIPLNAFGSLFFLLNIYYSFNRRAMAVMCVCVWQPTVFRESIICLL